MRVDQAMRLGPSGTGSVPLQQRPRRDPLSHRSLPPRDGKKTAIYEPGGGPRQTDPESGNTLTSASGTLRSAFLWLRSIPSTVFQLQQPKQAKVLSFITTPQSPILPESASTRLSPKVYFAIRSE